MGRFAALEFALLLVTVGCGNHESAGISIDRPIRRMIPPDARAMVGIDVTGLKNTEFYKRENGRLSASGLDFLAGRIGLDPRRDLSQVLAAWDGKKLLLIAEGRFSPADLERKLAAAGAHETHYRKYKLVGDIKNSVAFLNQDLTIAGPLAALEPAIDSFDDGKGGVPESLQVQLDKVRKNDQAWLASTGGLPFVEVQMRSDIESALSNIIDYVNGTRVGIRVDTGLHLQGEISCISERGAKRVHDTLRGVIAFARLSTKSNEAELLRIYDSIQVDQRQSAVDVRTDLSGDLADALLNRFQIGGVARHASDTH